MRARRSPVEVALALSFALALSALATGAGAGALPGATKGEAKTRVRRLTAFAVAKAPPPTPQPQPPTKVKGKECRGEDDCSPIEYTKCKEDPRDGKNRCLCLDNSPPANGACLYRPRELGQECRSDHECLGGGECRINPNRTSTPNTRYCLCRPGHLEINKQCSGGSVPSSLSWLLLYSLVLPLSLRLFATN